MELYKDRVNTIYLNGDPSWGVTATWRYNGGDPAPLTVAPQVNGRFAATLPYLPLEGEVEVTWTLTISGSGQFPRVDYYQVVTPYLERGEIMRIVEGEVSADDIDGLEASVRYIINSHTGQSFGSHTGTKIARGTGQLYLPLPARLLSFTAVSGFTGPATIVGDGWYLAPAGGTGGIPPTRADNNEVNNHYFDGINRQYTVPITDPRTRNKFVARNNYAVTGTWGWKYVPPEVKEAAKLLVNDLASGDTIYRDRYLTSMTAADWRIQFNSGAFARTGNVRVDQLLSQFVLTRGWAVI